MTPPTSPETADIETIAGRLTEMERKLFMGECAGWGSWMFSVGSDLVKKGLGRKSDGSIYFDTPLAIAVTAHLRSGDPQ